MRPIGKLLVVFLIGVCASALGVTASSAQVPFISFAFDEDPFYERDLSSCKPPYTLDTLEVVGYNFNSWLAGVDFRVQYPPALTYVQDIVDGTLWLGDTWGGIAIVWQVPKNGFEPVLLCRVQVYWTESCSCDGQPQFLHVLPFPGNPNPSFVRWPDYVQQYAVGFFSTICRTPPVPVRETTWGQIKALYR